MQNIEKSFLETTPLNKKIWKRNVDECFANVKTRANYELICYIKGIDINIQSAVVKRVNEKLLFSDTDTKKWVDSSLEFKVFRKLTFKERYLEYRSNDHTSHTQNTTVAFQKKSYYRMLRWWRKTSGNQQGEKKFKKKRLPAQTISNAIIA